MKGSQEALEVLALSVVREKVIEIETFAGMVQLTSLHIPKKDVSSEFSRPLFVCCVKLVTYCRVFT